MCLYHFTLWDRLMDHGDPDHKKKRIQQINAEQIRRIEEYKRIVSENAGYDLGDRAVCDWIQDHAAEFRRWVESVSFNCIRCGLCVHPPEDRFCDKVFHPERIRKLKKD